MLKRIKILSIYRDKNDARILLPKRMALLDLDAADALDSLNLHVEKEFGSLFLSDAYRTRAAQKKSHKDWNEGRKAAYSPPPGESLHEAGRAIDIDVKSLGMPLSRFWEIAAIYGWAPIIHLPDPDKSECWHFEYLAYWRGAPRDMIVFCKCAVLEAYLESDVIDLRKIPNALRILAQGYLRLLGLYTHEIDGICGTKTLMAIAKYTTLYTKRLDCSADIDVMSLGECVRDRWRHHKLGER